VRKVAVALALGGIAVTTIIQSHHDEKQKENGKGSARRSVLQVFPGVGYMGHRHRYARQARPVPPA